MAGAALHHLTHTAADDHTLVQRLLTANARPAAVQPGRPFCWLSQVALASACLLVLGMWRLDLQLYAPG
jgi:hypothetical protein